MLKYKDKILKSISILFIFFLGLLTERFQIDNKIGIFFKNYYDKSSRYIYGLLPKEEIEIFLDPKEFKEISNIRKESIKRSKLTKDLEKWSNGKISYKGDTRNIQIRLKGVFPDHWADSEQWSFKVKIKNDSKPINQLYRFALQPPKTTSYIYEWLFMKSLEKENLFSLGIDYLDLKVNNNHIGLYSLIGQISES